MKRRMGQIHVFLSMRYFSIDVIFINRSDRFSYHRPISSINLVICRSGWVFVERATYAIESTAIDWITYVARLKQSYRCSDKSYISEPFINYVMLKGGGGGGGYQPV